MLGEGQPLIKNDLINHLKNNKNFFASFDVFDIEPLPKVTFFEASKCKSDTPRSSDY